MTPILVRPVREQLEHDRVIRLLQARWRRKYLVTINQGSEQTASVTNGDSTCYPDLVLASLDRGHKPEIIVEVETAESVNNLEAMAQWARMARHRAAFHLYVPTGSVDAARRLCTEHNIPVAEISTYHPVGDQMRFTTVYKAPPAPRIAARRVEPAAAPKPRQASGNGPARTTATPRRAAKTAVAPSRPRVAMKAAAAKPAQKRKH
ncbi:MAG: hypothetical protein EHM24_26485 [Acidobacteria bacterium]